MPTGFRAFNDSGTLVVDETYKNLCVRSKGAFTVNSAGNGPNTTFSGVTSPILVVRPTGGRVWHASVTSGGLMVVRGEPGTAITWWLFDVPAAPYANYGLVVRDSAGNVTFDATKQYARLRATISLSTAYPGTHGVSYDAGRTYAIAVLKAPVFSELIFTRAPSPPWPPNYYFSSPQRDVVGITMSGSGVVYSNLRLYTPPGDDPPPLPTPRQRQFESQTGSYAIVDVTGY